MNAHAPRHVASSEHDLLVLARALVGEMSPELVGPLSRASVDLPPTIGEGAAALLEQTLAKGAVRTLLRRGGWRRAESLGDDGGPPRSGRLWQRRPAPALRFSPASMRLLRWLQGSGIGATLPRDICPAGWGDELLFFLASDLMQELGMGERGGWLACRGALSWIANLDQIALCRQAEGGMPDLRPLFSGDGASLLEALQPDLARRWLHTERAKGSIEEAATMIRLGALQRRTMVAMTQAARETGRVDLLGFLLDAASSLLRDRPPASRWTAALKVEGQRLATRAEAAREAGAFLQELAAVVALFDEARSARFFDDDYERSQLLLRMRERLGDEQDHAREIIGQLGALDQAAAMVSRNEEEPA